jgi:uncharacterized protein YbjT (DUF2867 family)
MNRRIVLLALSCVVGIPGVLHGAGQGSVLVFGGTGQLGADVVQRLVALGEEVVVFVRPSSDRKRLASLDVDYVVGDMLKEQDVSAAFQSRKIRAVINTVRAPISERGFYDITSRWVVAHAKQAGVAQIIHHGAVGAGENRELFPDVPWDRVPGLAVRMDDHRLAEKNFMASGIATVVIRNSRVWPHGTPSTGKASLTEDQSVMTPITRADLADFTLHCLDNPACAGKIYHAVDPALTWPPPGRE